MAIPEPGCCDGPNELLRKILIGLPEVGTSTAVSPQYGYFYNLSILTPIPIEGDFPFDLDGQFTSGFTHAANSPDIVIVNSGIYSVQFSASTTESGQIQLFLGGIDVPGACYGSGAGTQQNHGFVIISATAGQSLNIRNHSSAAALTPQSLSGGTQLNSVNSLLITKLA